MSGFPPWIGSVPIVSYFVWIYVLFLWPLTKLPVEIDCMHLNGVLPPVWPRDAGPSGGGGHVTGDSEMARISGQRSRRTRVARCWNKLSSERAHIFFGCNKLLVFSLNLSAFNEHSLVTTVPTQSFETRRVFPRFQHGGLRAKVSPFFTR
jgi:hypothetical protein